MFVLHIILHLPLSPAGEYWKHFRGRPCLLSWQLYSVSFVVWLDHKYLGNQASVGSHLKVFQYCYAFTKKKKMLAQTSVYSCLCGSTSAPIGSQEYNPWIVVMCVVVC